MGLVIETHVGDKGMGYIPDRALRSDRPLTLMLAPSTLPDASPVWPLNPVTSDQGSLGSCTGNSTLDAKEDLARVDGVDVEWSRLFGYLGGRLKLNGLSLADYLASPASVKAKMTADTGAMIRDVVTFLNEEGCMSEALHPYYIERFANLPDQLALAQAHRHKLIAMKTIASSEEMRVAIHQGHPIVLGFTVYASFGNVGLDGNFRIPSGGVRGGHAVRAVMHVKSKVVPGFSPGASLIRNSWGPDWGCSHPTLGDKIPGKGFFWMPDEIVDSSDVDDIWAFEHAE